MNMFFVFIVEKFDLHMLNSFPFKWQMQGVVNFFGRISILVDQNTQAIHMFMSALLQVLYLSFCVHFMFFFSV